MTLESFLLCKNALWLVLQQTDLGILWPNWYLFFMVAS